MNNLHVDITCVDGLYLKAPASKICVLSPTMTMTAVCDFLLDCFHFDNLHTHHFFHAKVAYAMDRTSVGDTASLNDALPAPAGQTLFMWYDVGDDWLFQFSLLKRMPATDETTPRLIESIGENPIQYPYDDRAVRR